MSIGLEKLLLTNQSLKEDEVYWYFSQQVLETNTPSRREGMSFSYEANIRRGAVRFIKKLAEVVYEDWATKWGLKSLNVPVPLPAIVSKVHATASVWFHRFFMVHSIQMFDDYVVAAACFYLAAKVEDYPQSTAAVAHFSKEILNQWGISPEWNDFEDELCKVENCLIQTLGFVIWVKHPHLYIPAYIHQLIGDVEKLQRIQQLAVEYASDSLGTTFCIRINPRKLAIVFIAWACREEEFPLDNWKHKGGGSHENWLESFNITEDSVNELYQEYMEHAGKDKEEMEALMMLNIPSSSSSASAASQGFPFISSCSSSSASSSSSSSGSSTSSSSSSSCPSPSSYSSTSCDAGGGTPANHHITAEFASKEGAGGDKENYHLSVEKKLNGAYDGSFFPEVGPVV